MTCRGHVPQRMCAGCGKRAPRHELVRFRVTHRGDRPVLVIDATCEGGGRGVWLCPEAECFDAGMKRDSLRRRLRAEANTDSLRQEFIEHIEDLERTDGKKESI